MNSASSQPPFDDLVGADSTDWVEVYQASRYAIPDGPNWFVFALNGEAGPRTDWTESITLLTAWNPNSEELELAENEVAQKKLEAALHASGVEFDLAWGGSLPDVTPSWREPGFVVYGWTREEAAEWGRAWGQRAVVYLDAESVELLFCKSEVAVSCGLAELPGEARDWGKS